MARYYLHLKKFEGELVEDSEGSELPNVASARDQAVTAMQELLGHAVLQGTSAEFEAIIVADEQGRQVAFVPVVVVLPTSVVNSLRQPPTAPPVVETMQDYRRNAAHCRRMAESAESAEDRSSWLKLADAWLRMLPSHLHSEAEADVPGWPKSTDEDSQATH